MTESGWNNLGLYLSNRGDAADRDAAVAAFKKSLELRPGFVSAKLSLALTHRVRGEDREAIDGLFGALSAGQASPERTVLDWALYYDENHKAVEARDVLERGAQRYPDNEPVHRALAIHYFQEKDCRRGDATLSRFEASTQEPQTLNTLALIRACVGRRGDAVALFRRSLALVPDQKTVVQSLDLLQAGAASSQ